MFTSDEKRKIDEFCEENNSETIIHYDEKDKDFKELYREVKKIAMKYHSAVSIPLLT